MKKKLAPNRNTSSTVMAVPTGPTLARAAVSNRGGSCPARPCCGEPERVRLDRRRGGSISALASLALAGAPDDAPRRGRRAERHAERRGARARGPRRGRVARPRRLQVAAPPRRSGGGTRTGRPTSSSSSRSVPRAEDALGFSVAPAVAGARATRGSTKTASRDS